ncbi:hypothetical protein Tco_1464996 [Tanacetum coccineum]
MALVPAAGVILGIGPLKSAFCLVLGSSPWRLLQFLSKIVDSVGLLINLGKRAGNAINTTWSLDTPGDWKRLTINVIFKMCSRGFSSLFPRNTLTSSPILEFTMPGLMSSGVKAMYYSMVSIEMGSKRMMMIIIIIIKLSLKLSVDSLVGLDNESKEREEEYDLKYFDTFPTREELEYHEWLLSTLTPSQ